MLEFWELKCQFWYGGELVESSYDTVLATEEEMEKMVSKLNIKDGKKDFHSLVSLNEIGSNAVRFDIGYFRSKPYVIKIVSFPHSISILWHSKIKSWKHIATYKKEKMSIQDMLEYHDGERVFQYFKEHNVPVVFGK